MSRIERALEKALKMRRSEAAPGRTAWPTTYTKFDPSVFEVGEGGIDTAGVDSHIVSITDPYSFAAEEYRKLRARIFQVTERDFLNTLMVTSSEAGEGKTVTAINLAVAIAHEHDRTVLLVDADLRKPSVHRYLGVKPKYGLSDYLGSRRELSLSDIMIKTGIGKLVVLPAGSPPEKSAELISSDRMRMFIREIKHRYRDRYVIFDSSPLLMTADALSLCDYMDGIIFVVQAARTPKNAVTQAFSLIKGYNVLGTVFNDVPKYLAKNLYPYYYRSEYGGAVKALEHADSRDAVKALDYPAESGEKEKTSDNADDGNTVKTIDGADGGNNGRNPENA
jgi:receptor protein-tyrosine kinase/non-specific protein-tyrosine kinase